MIVNTNFNLQKQTTASYEPYNFLCRCETRIVNSTIEDSLIANVEFQLTIEYRTSFALWIASTADVEGFRSL